MRIDVHERSPCRSRQGEAMTDTDSAEPTARPWSAEWTTTRFDWRVVSDDRKTIATLGGPKDINEANAAQGTKKDNSSW